MRAADVPLDATGERWTGIPLRPADDRGDARQRGVDAVRRAEAGSDAGGGIPVDWWGSGAGVVTVVVRRTTANAGVN